jgi:histidine ammonia-lyase
MKNSLEINGNHLTVNGVYDVAHSKIKVKLSKESQRKVEKSQKIIEGIVKKGTPIYGINTGFGGLATVTIKDDDLTKLQENLILSHSAGTGLPFSKEEVRAAILVRANSLAKGYSGIRYETIMKLLEILNKDIYPYVPMYGSLGASGDLAPLAHIALLLVGKGKIIKDSKYLEFKDFLEEYQFVPLQSFAPKEGLALINGTSFEAGVSSILSIEGEYIFNKAIESFAMVFEALGGKTDAFDEDIQKLRNSQAQEFVSKDVLNLIKGSTLINRNRNVQDAYTLRCVPQIYGAVFENLSYIKTFLQREINATTDNPIIFEDGRVISGGNFHAQPLSFLMDLYTIVFTTLSNVIERQINRVLNPSLSGLKPFLANNPGVESGMMILQYTAASLVAENKILSHPASVDSFPVSADQEDYVSMGMNAVIKARKVLENARKVVAIELIVGSQALEMVLKSEKKLKTGKKTEEIFNNIRKIVKFADTDREFSYDIESVENALKDHTL